MKPNDRTKFLEWYSAEKQRNVIFNNRIEILKYCKEDVSILRLACLKFRSIMLETTSIEPFKQITLAGTAMAVFRTLFLKENQIAIIPRNGYRFVDNQSFKALKWLEWESYVRNIKIHTAANGREIRIFTNIVVDGFYPPKSVFCFLGCYWHQCIECYPNQFHQSLEDRGMKIRSLYESYLARAEKIKSLGYDLIEIWEHQFDKMMKENPAIDQYIKTIDHLKVPPLNPRDAFMGGRTGVCKLYHKAMPNEKILYYDVTSLYPYINKYGKYPVGTPQILVGHDLFNRTVFDIEGILKVDILPPKKLYHPVLGVKLLNKLMFALCYKCASNMQSEECLHTDDERMIHGTYVADELRVAVEKGYKILKIYEAWEYKTTQYNKSEDKCGIFGEYIDTFLKIKTQASGFPQWCQTDDDKDQYIQKFLEHEGIQLDKKDIIKNSGYRSLAKLLLNSLWGRLGMRSDKSKKAFVDDSNDLLNLVTNPSYDVSSFYELNSDSLLVSYTKKKMNITNCKLA